ncbi:hypothetical protein LTR56_027730 [Elasticomyces elasticus]|nr:hypothetical protein LTR56_027730 [Elasticomyces elasticus]KAK3614499.1 hypothetical protein LTR22_027758 [Elasticomyces elasticus]
MHDADLIAVAKAWQPSIVVYHDKKNACAGATASTERLLEPTADELKTLQRMGGKIPWQSYTIAFVELAERFSYYGTTAVFVNFLQKPRPYDSQTGAIVQTQARYDAIGTEACVQPGGLGQGQQASTGLTTSNQV